MYKTTSKEYENEWESDKQVEILNLESHQVDLIFNLLQKSVLSRYKLSCLSNGFQLGILKWNDTLEECVNETSGI